MFEYIRKDMRQVEGWLSRCDAEMFATLLSCQTINNFSGAVAEIGVHHGKSFILMARGNQSQAAYAIDIFEQQHLNIDGSGRGDKSEFLANLQNHKVCAEAVVIDERLSSEVMPEDILSTVGRTRFFHVDGGHHINAVLHDLKLAEAVVRDEGIIVVDDAFRSEWPEVSMGLFAHLTDCDDFVLFAVGFNKAYLCRRAYADLYQSALIQNEFISMYFSKVCETSVGTILVYQRYPLPEWSVKTKLFDYIKMNYPEVAHFIHKNILGRNRNVYDA